MKNSVIKKLVITIEATKCNSISNDVMTSITNLGNSIASKEGLKLTLTSDKSANGEASNQMSLHNFLDVNRHHNLSPENWDYWPV